MNVLIAEDETLAAERIQELLLACDPEARVVDRVDSVDDLVEFFRSGKTTDLLLLDIQLADGKSFELFDRVQVDVPVIFVTAFDQYALQAFQYFSLDYILKPVQHVDLAKALQRFRRVANDKKQRDDEHAAIRALAENYAAKRKERIVIKSGNKLVFKYIDDAGYFFADGKSIYMVCQDDSRRFLVDYTLDELETILNRKTFFRINRKFIINIRCIQEIKSLTGSRYEIQLRIAHDQSLQVSRERSHEFRCWLDQ